MRCPPAPVPFTIFPWGTIASVFSNSRMLAMMPGRDGTPPADSDLRTVRRFPAFSRRARLLPLLRRLHQRAGSQNGALVESLAVLEDSTQFKHKMKSQARK